ncbi:MAG TPA: hypothetical protein VNT51_06655 [Miltoncostaeaceae bacterium]|nr:hypothetical protein [Miltoncostaeaceae bacterium]
MTHPVLAEIEEWDRNRPRSQQVEIGASGLFGCRAAAVLRLNRVEETDARLRWDALVGTAIHAVAEQAAGPGVLVEHRLPYRGVMATIDRYDPATKTLTDLKTKDNPAALRRVARYGPSRQQIAQVMLGAAALQEAGHEVETVELLYLPRIGDPAEAYLWSAAPEREIADEAVVWAERVNATALDRSHLEPAEMVRGLQDEGLSFCERYCAYFTACRGVPQWTELEDVL